MQDPRSFQPQPFLQGEDVTLIYSSAVVDVIRKSSQCIDEFIDRNTGKCFVYPDGSIEIFGEDAAKEFECLGGRVFRGTDVRPQCHWVSITYRSLRHHRDSISCIYMCGKWVPRLRDGSLVIVTERSISPYSGFVASEGSPSSVVMTVTLMKTVTNKLRMRLDNLMCILSDATMMYATNDSNDKILVRSASLAKTAFRLDLDLSAASSLNVKWMLLNILDLCSASPIHDISFIDKPFRLAPAGGFLTWDELLGPFTTTGV